MFIAPSCADQRLKSDRAPPPQSALGPHKPTQRIAINVPDHPPPMTVMNSRRSFDHLARNRSRVACVALA